MSYLYNAGYWLAQLLTARWLSILTTCIGLFILFGVDQINHLVFHLPSMRAFWLAQGWLAVLFWVFVFFFLAYYLYCIIHVIPHEEEPKPSAPEQPARLWRRRDTILLLVGVLALVLALAIDGYDNTQDPLDESPLALVIWIGGLALTMERLVAWLFRWKADKVFDLPWRLLLQSEVSLTSAGIGGVFLGLLVLGLLFWDRCCSLVPYHAFQGFLGILLGYCCWLVGCWAHGSYRDLKRTQLLARPIGRALTILLIVNILGEIVWLLATHAMAIASLRNYSIWCAVHILCSLILVARLLDDWQAKTHAPVPGDNQRTRFLPIRMLGIVSALTILYLTTEAAHVGSEASASAAPTKLAWLEELHARIKSCPEGEPVVVVAASGGGSRAALFTALVYEYLAHKPLSPTRKWGEQVVLISSVSGGSLASAYFATDFGPNKTRTRGAVLRPDWHNSFPAEIERRLAAKSRHFHQKFTKDYHEILKKMPPKENWSEEDKVKMDSLEHNVNVWKDTAEQCRDFFEHKQTAPETDWLLQSRFVDDMCTDIMAPLMRGALLPGKERGVRVTEFWSGHFQQLDDPSSWPRERPCLLLNASTVAMVDQRQRLVLGFPQLPRGFLQHHAAYASGWSLCDLDEKYQLSVAEGVRLSANFPWGFDPGLLNIKPKEDCEKPLRVMDGGVFDNTGIDTVFNVIHGIERCTDDHDDRVRKLATTILNELKKRSVLLLEIDSGANPGRPDFIKQGLKNLFEPLEALEKASFTLAKDARANHLDGIKDLTTWSCQDEHQKEQQIESVRLLTFRCNHIEDVMTAWALGPDDKAAILAQFLFEVNRKRTDFQDTHKLLRKSAQFVLDREKSKSDQERQELAAKYKADVQQLKKDLSGSALMAEQEKLIYQAANPLNKIDLNKSSKDLMERYKTKDKGVSASKKEPGPTAPPPPQQPLPSLRPTIERMDDARQQYLQKWKKTQPAKK